MKYAELSQTIQSYVESTEQLFVENIPVFVQQAERRIYNTVQIPSLRKNVTGVLTAGNQYLSAPNDYLSTFSLAVIDSNNNYQFLLNKDVNFLREAYPTTVFVPPTNQGTPQSVPKYYALFGTQFNNQNELSFLLAPTPDDSYNVELHYFYYPPTIVQGVIDITGVITPGTSYTAGKYLAVPLSGGQGTGAIADITISGGGVTSVDISYGGALYVQGNVLTAPSSLIGNTGTGFSVTVGAVSNPNGTSWLGDNYSPVLLYGAMREAILFQKGEQDLVAYYEKQFQDALQQLNRLGTGLERGDSFRDGQAKIKVNP